METFYRSQRLKKRTRAGDIRRGGGGEEQTLKPRRGEQNVEERSKTSEGGVGGGGRETGWEPPTRRAPFFVLVGTARTYKVGSANSASAKRSEAGRV